MIEVYNKEIPQQIRAELIVFLGQNRSSSVFHSPAVYDIYYDSKYYEPALYVVRNKGEIQGVMLAVIICSYHFGAFGKRGLIMQEPVVKDDNPEVFNNLFYAYFNLYKKKVLFTEVRNISHPDIFNPFYQKFGFKLQKRVNLVLELKNENTFRNLSESKQRQINAGIQAGAEIGEITTVEEIQEFYQILKDLYKQIKKPLPHISFFRSALQAAKQNEGVNLISVKYRHKIIGGMLLLGTKGETFYEWYIGGLHNQYKDLFPSVLATWGGIEKAMGLNANNFDFMGGGTPDASYGVREFKARFGSEQINSYRWYHSAYEPIFKMAKKIKKL